MQIDEFFKNKNKKSPFFFFLRNENLKFPTLFSGNMPMIDPKHFSEVDTILEL